jgi:hypothetical protein
MMVIKLYYFDKAISGRSYGKFRTGRKTGMTMKVACLVRI